MTTPEQEANLLALADFLDTDPADFDMWTFAKKKGEILQVDEPIECGTVCCAVGYSAVIFPEKLKEFLKTHLDPDWMDYGDYVFGNLGIGWDWLFSGSWSAVDNTPKGAAKRIRDYVKNGVPEWFVKDVMYDSPIEFLALYKGWHDVYDNELQNKESTQGSGS